MKMILYKTKSNSHVQYKKLTDPIEIDGLIKDRDVETSDPQITFQEFAGCNDYNYLYIPAFNRYYFRTEGNKIVRNGHQMMSFHVDVLYTYRELLNNELGYVDRSAQYANFRLRDGALPVQADSKIFTRKVVRGPFSDKQASCILTGLNSLYNNKYTERDPGGIK